MSKLLAPNGEPSNLTPEQYKLVRTPAFKEWFGDWENDPENSSKVIDEETKEPLVVYHGGDSDFNVFDLNKTTNKRFHFTTDIEYAKFRGGISKSYFLKINNLTYEDWSDRRTLPKPKGKFVGFGNLLNDIKNLKEVIVFESTQIKLADGTNTTFDGDNPDIRFNNGGSILLAPNGKPSKLTPEQYDLVRTPAFKEWFGDWEKNPANASRIVDENREPLVVWRGVKANNYDYQKQGYNYFAKNKSYGKVYGDILHPFFLNIRNPLDLEFFNKISSENGLTSFNNEGLFQIGDLQLTNQFENETTLLYLDDLNDVAGKFNFLFENGDGIIGYDIGFYGKEIVFVTKQPNQVKLADGTNNTFDSNNPDIRFEDGGELNKGLFSQIWGWFGIKF